MPESSQTTIIGADTKIKGEMSFDSTARLLGHFDGKITAKGELQIADGAQCKASVEAAKVVVDGLVEGNINAREKVELTARARMKGDLVAAKLVVADGATFNGHVSVGPDAKPSSGGTIPSSLEGKPSQGVGLRQ